MSMLFHSSFTRSFHFRIFPSLLSISSSLPSFPHSYPYIDSFPPYFPLSLERLQSHRQQRAEKANEKEVPRGRQLNPIHFPIHHASNTLILQTDSDMHFRSPDELERREDPFRLVGRRYYTHEQDRVPDRRIQRRRTPFQHL